MIYADPRGDVWVGTQEGLFHYRPDRDRVERVETGAGAPLNGDINALALDAVGGLWVGGDQGLAYLSRSQEQLRWIAIGNADAQLANLDVLGLHVYARGAIWFDCPSGLFRLEKVSDATGRALAVSAELDPSGRPFGANLLSDSVGRIWTQRNVFDPSVPSLVALTPADGIDIGTAWFRSYAKTRDGRLLYGGSKGVLEVRPELYRVPGNAPCPAARSIGAFPLSPDPRFSGTGVRDRRQMGLAPIWTSIAVKERTP